MPPKPFRQGILNPWPGILVLLLVESSSGNTYRLEKQGD